MITLSYVLYAYVGNFDLDLGGHLDHFHNDRGW